MPKEKSSRYILPIKNDSFLHEFRFNPVRVLRYFLKRAMKVWFVNFWCSPQEMMTCRHFFKAFKHVIPNMTLNSYKPDIVFHSLFGPPHAIDNAKYINSTKVFYSGENTDLRFPEYANIDQHTDFYINYHTLKARQTTPKICQDIRIPLWFFCFDFYKRENSTTLEYIKNNKITNANKRQGTALIARSDFYNFRQSILDIFKRHKINVACPSTMGNNMPSIGPDIKDKIEFLENYAINICSENMMGEGYLTEKLFECVMSGCIPLYDGAFCQQEKYGLLMEHDIFNTDRIIMVSPTMVDQTIRVLDNPDKMLGLPMFLPTAFNAILNMCDEFDAFTREIVKHVEARKQKHIL